MVDDQVKTITLRTEVGPLVGLIDKRVWTFKGVPYAHPPFGARRWQAPSSPPSWNDPLDVTRAGESPPQPVTRFTHYDGPDCLNLNIWCPEHKAYSKLRPVLVWIPGGGFIGGSNNDPVYDGTAFASGGLTVVSVNYRLGVDGFMYFPGIVPNRGLLDLLAALEWIEKNIHSFGGDPANVTLAGGSAGGGAITLLMAMSQSRGLFKNVILQSASLAFHTMDEAIQARTALARLLGIGDSIREFESISVSDLQAAVGQLASNRHLRMQLGMSPRHLFPVRPVIDGEQIKTHPLSAASSRSWPLARPHRAIIGSSAEEMQAVYADQAVRKDVDLERIEEFAALVMNDPSRASSLYPPSGGIADALSQLQSDYYYRYPARLIADKLVECGVETFQYESTWRSPQHEGRLGAAHGVDTPLFFGNLDAERAMSVLGDSPPRELSQRMHRSWVSFALDQVNEGWIPWHPTARKLLRFGEVCEMAEDDLPIKESVNWRYA